MKPPPALLNNPLEGLVGYRLRRASAGAMAELAGELGEIGLRPTEGSVLLLVAANPGITQSEIGRILGIQRANMTPLTAALDRRGLLSRKRADGRSQGLVTTDEGARLAERAGAAMAAHDARLLDRLSAEQKDSLTAALAALWRDPPEG